MKYRLTLAVGIVSLMLSLSAAIIGTLVALGYMRDEWSGVAFAWGCGTLLLGGFCIGVSGDMKE